MEHTDCQVLAPDSVAWYIQAALTADRIGNEHTRDLALAEAQRIAEKLRLHVPHECNGGQLATIERRQWEDAETFGEHARQLNALANRVRTLEDRDAVDSHWRETTHTRLAEQAPEPCYDCRTTGEHLESQGRMITSLHEHQVLDARQLEALELNHRTMHDTFNQHQARLAALEWQQREQALVLVSHDEHLEAIDGELGDQTQRLSAIENRARLMRVEGNEADDAD